MSNKKLLKKASLDKPTLIYELNLAKKGAKNIAGIDEVGRGSIAGPVAAAAIILPENPRPWFNQVNDSKLLSGPAREKLSREIIRDAQVGLSMVTAEVIDEIGIINATKSAMVNAVKALGPHVDGILIDAIDLPESKIGHRISIIHGDQLSISISSASIVAKVARDSLMKDLDKLFPGYHWSRNKGYGTKGHLQAISTIGPSILHRKTFLTSID